jgi:hypothetical protein
MAGRYGILFKVPFNDPRISTVSFAVRIEGEANAWFQMHPNVPRYDAWAKTITAELRREFDEAERWKTALETATLNHMLPGGTHGPTR